VPKSKNDAQRTALRKFFYRKLMISNCKLYRINKRIPIMIFVPMHGGIAIAMRASGRFIFNGPACRQAGTNAG